MLTATSLIPWRLVGAAAASLACFGGGCYVGAKWVHADWAEEALREDEAAAAGGEAASEPATHDGAGDDAGAVEPGMDETAGPGVTSQPEGIVDPEAADDPAVTSPAD